MAEQAELGQGWKSATFHFYWPRSVSRFIFPTYAPLGSEFPGQKYNDILTGNGFQHFLVLMFWRIDVTTLFQLMLQ